MKRQKMIILPRIYDAGGDVGRTWFIFFSVRNPGTGKMERFRKSGDINRVSTLKARKLRAETLREEYSQKLKAGWSPYTDDEDVIYDDHLQYRSVADIYRQKRKSNRTLHFFSSNFINQIKNELMHATVLTYTSKLRTFNAWIDGRGDSDNDVTEVDNRTILDFFSFLIEKRQLSGNSIRKYRQILLNLFEFIIQEKGMRINPVYNVPKCGRINDQAARPVYRMDINVFKEKIAPADPQLWMAIEFQYYCYIRLYKAW